MTEQKHYWIADPAGAYAVVEGAAERDEWTKVHGWSDARGPAAGDFVWLQHAEHGGRQKFPVEVVEQWAGLGWELARPAAAPDLTKDPAFVDPQPAEAAPVTAPAKPKTTSATGGEQSKETSRG